MSDAEQGPGRRRAALVFAPLALLCACGAPPDIVPPPAMSQPGPPTIAALTPSEIATRSTASVVLIRTPSGLGTGFAVDADRIATNLHVIFGASAAQVLTSDGRTFEDVRVVAIDTVRDLALLRVPSLGLPGLPIAADADPSPGEPVIAIGHPLGLGHTVSDGLISGIRHVDAQLTLLQISAPIAPGSSGGPLFNEHGEVIGVATLQNTLGQNVNFGVPIRCVRPLLAEQGDEPLAEFTRKIALAQGLRGPRREVPRHDVAVLGDCGVDEIQAVVTSIGGAIESGAPLYNEGNHEACFRIYEGAALTLDRILRDCGGLRRALSEGLERADALPSYTAKAWAMRDAFDGVIDVIRRATEGEDPAEP